MKGQIYQINLKPETPGQHGLPKRPVESAMVTFMGLKGDFNRWRREEAHDDLDLALLIMALEKIQELNQGGWPVKPGDIGENILTVGIPYDDFAPGKTYSFGEAQIQIVKACTPCTNLYSLPYVGEEKGPRFLRVMLGKRGWYARVLQEGQIKTGDSIEELVKVKL